MIPVFEKLPDAEAPEGTHFIRARNGTFLRNRQWWIDATVPVEMRNGTQKPSSTPRRKLLSEKVSAKLLLPPLPAYVIGKALKLSKLVCDMSKSEVCALIFLSERDGYQLYVPPQSVSPGGIEYVPYAALKGERYVGSIHSHGLMPAFHSDVDEADEFSGNDGVHMTLGSLREYPRFSFSAMIAINRRRFPVEPSWFLGLRESDRLHELVWPDAETWEVPKDCLSKVIQIPLIRSVGERL